MLFQRRVGIDYHHGIPLIPPQRTVRATSRFLGADRDGLGSTRVLPTDTGTSSLSFP